MALSNAERQRRHYERQKEAAKKAACATDRFTTQTFNQYLPHDGNYDSEVLFPLEWAGINPDAVPSFANDDDPGFDLESEQLNRGSIGRAERMVSMLLDAASGMASVINRYKRHELNNKLAELERAGLYDPFLRSEADAQRQEIQSQLLRLEKDVRWTLREWKVKGA